MGKRRGATLAWFLVVAAIAGACSQETPSPGMAYEPEPEHIAALGDCGARMMDASGGLEGLDDAFHACGSVEEFVAATALRPGLFAEPLAAIDHVLARCTSGDEVGSSRLCRSDSLKPKTPPPPVDAGPNVAIDPAYRAYLEELAAEEKRAERQAERAQEKARKEAAALERKRQKAEQARADTQRARAAKQRTRRALAEYEASAWETYGRVQEAARAWYSANLGVEGLTRAERRAINNAMDRHRVPAVQAIRRHLSYMDANPASTCPGNLYRVDRELAQRWRGLLVRGNYPNTITGEGRSIRLDFDAAFKRTATFLRNLGTRVSRCG